MFENGVESTRKYYAPNEVFQTRTTRIETRHAPTTAGSQNTHMLQWQRMLTDNCRSPNQGVQPTSVSGSTCNTRFVSFRMVYHNSGLNSKITRYPELVKFQRRAARRRGSRGAFHPVSERVAPPTSLPNHPFSRTMPANRRVGTLDNEAFHRSRHARRREMEFWSNSLTDTLRLSSGVLLRQQNVGAGDGGEGACETMALPNMVDP